MTHAVRHKKLPPAPDRFARVREHELRALIEELDEALTIVGSGIRMLGPDRSRISPALKRAIDYLRELRERNGGAAP